MMHKGFRLRAAQGRASIAREREPTSTASATARLRAAGASSPTGGCSSSPTARLRAALKLAYGRLQLAYRQPDTARLRAAAVHLESAPTGGNTLQLAYGRLQFVFDCLPTGGMVARLRAATESLQGSAICSPPWWAANVRIIFHLVLVFGCQQFLPELPQLFIYIVYVYRFIYLFHRVPTVPEAIYIYYQPLTDIFPPMAGHRTLIVAGE